VLRVAKGRIVRHLNRTAAGFLAAALFAAPSGAAISANLDDPNVATGEGDAIFAVDEGGFLEPIAVRIHGKFLNPGSTDGQPSDKLRMEANASIATSGQRVHVIFGRRVVATVPAKIAKGSATITVPASLHLGANIEALASPTLTGHAGSARRALTAAERKAALAVAIAALGTEPATALDVRNLTAIDLGNGTGFVGTIFVSGAATTHKDRHLFFIAERTNGTLRATLTNLQTMQSNAEFTGTGEALVDAIDLAPGTPAVITRILGYDAHTFAIYTRKNGTWKSIYTGGGVAL
jgi:hypothetical protein